jgi:hypothetical protein
LVKGLIGQPASNARTERKRLSSWEGAKHIAYTVLIIGGSLGVLFVIGVSAQNSPYPH